MDHSRLTRRRFTVCMIALAGAAGIPAGPGLFTLSRAWAETPDKLDKSTRQEMVGMARLLYPHDSLSDEVYANVLDQAVSAVASDEAFARQLDQAAAALAERTGGTWQDLDPAAQIKTMQSIENESYFIAIQNQVRVGIYNGPDLWKHVGYLGPSKDFGGYLHRGAGDIDWLPEDS